MKSDAGNARSQLASARQPIQPPGQVWSLADRLVTAWDQRCHALSNWYDHLAARLGALEANLEAARGMHRRAEESASDLARKGMD